MATLVAALDGCQRWKGSLRLSGRAPSCSSNDFEIFYSREMDEFRVY